MGDRPGASCAFLAEQLYVSEGDVAVIVASLGLDPTVDVPDAWLGHVHDMLDPHGERTAPDRLYWPTADAELPPESGATLPSPTREPRYPDL